MTTLFPGGPVLLSSVPIEGDLTVITGTTAVNIYNDMSNVFSIDSEFIAENVMYTITSFKNSKTMSNLFLQCMNCFMECTSVDIHNIVYNDKIVNKELAQLFGYVLGVYIGLRSGYTKFFIPDIETNTHPATQQKLITALMNVTTLIQSNLEQVSKNR